MEAQAYTSADTVKGLHDFISSLRARQNALGELKSRYDLEEQDILHYIEFARYNAVDGSRLLKKLKEVRTARRVVKDEYEANQSILARLNSAGLVNFTRPNKTYHYRVISLESILKEE